MISLLLDDSLTDTQYSTTGECSMVGLHFRESGGYVVATVSLASIRPFILIFDQFTLY